MKLTYRDVVESKQAIEGLLRASPPPTAAIAVKIAVNARQINGAISDFSEAQKSLFDGYAVTDEDQPKIPDEKMDEYREEIEELLDQDVDLKIRTIRMAELERCEEKRPGFELQPGALYNAWFMFDLEEVDDEPVD